MKNFLVGFICFFVAVQSFANDARDAREASELVKKFSETIACQMEGLDHEKNQYKAATIVSGDDEYGGAMLVVFWYGDIGCSGGNGTMTPNFTVVEYRGSSGKAATVMLNYKFPDLNLAHVSSFSAKNGILNIKGVTYGPKDFQHNPKKPVSYRLKFINDKFVKL